MTKKRYNIATLAGAGIGTLLFKHKNYAKSPLQHALDGRGKNALISAAGNVSGVDRNGNFDLGSMNTAKGGAVGVAISYFARKLRINQFLPAGINL